MSSIKTLSKTVAEQIEKQIICGAWKVGSQIPTEQELMEQFDVSRITVREAIKSLVSKNVLEIHRGRGTFISGTPGLTEDPLGIKFLHDENITQHFFEARQIFEPEVNRLATLRADEEEIELLGQIARNLDALDALLDGANTPDEVVQAISEKDIAFHTLLCKMSKNPIFERILPVIIKSVRTSYDQFIPRISNGPRVSTHYAIYEAVRDRDPERACQMTIQHLKNSRIGFEERQPAGEGGGGDQSREEPSPDCDKR